MYCSFDALKEDTNRPLWSVMIPTYNCPRTYLIQTLESVLQQDPGIQNMQIEVVDNCSTKDDPEVLIKEISKGRITFSRNHQNIGIINNFNSCIQRARGYWVHILHSDDIVKQGFYQSFQAAFEREPNIGAAFCRHIYIDEKGYHTKLSPGESEEAGILANWIERIAVKQLIQAPAIVVKRSIYEELGGFLPELSHAADWEMWQRIAAHYPVWYEPQALACYRRHSATDSSRLMRSGSDLVDIRKAIKLSRIYLSSENANRLSAEAREYYALRAINILASRMLEQGDIAAATAQLREALRCSSSLKVIRSLANFFVGAMKSWVKQVAN